MTSDSLNLRPIVYDYGSPPEFLKALLAHYKATSQFSLRQRTEKVGNCSQALVSQILSGKRKLKRDQMPSLAQIFKLTSAEQSFIDKKLFCKLDNDIVAGPKHSKPKIAKNHLLADWINPYVKDAIHLKGFSLDSEKIFSMLQGMASPVRISKSVNFLLSQGFWRKTSEGSLVPEDPMTVTTNNIPSQKIQNFHKKALELAQKGLTSLPPDRRKSSTVILSIDEEDLVELRSLLDSFQQQLSEFIERHPKGKDSLVQITMHLTPVGRKND